MTRNFTGSGEEGSREGPVAFPRLMPTYVSFWFLLDIVSCDLKVWVYHNYQGVKTSDKYWKHPSSECRWRQMLRSLTCTHHCETGLGCPPRSAGRPEHTWRQSWLRSPRWLNLTFMTPDVSGSNLSLWIKLSFYHSETEVFYSTARAHITPLKEDNIWKMIFTSRVWAAVVQQAHV